MACFRSDRLRQVDVKAEHFERQVQRVEQERDSWEKKYEVRLLFFFYRTHFNICCGLQDAQEKYKKSQAELQELVVTMEGL